MKPAPFGYCAPVSLDEAIEMLRRDEQARPIAGGQSLVPMLALRLVRPTTLVDLNRIDALRGISAVGGAIRIGAMTRQTEALRSPELAAHAPVLLQALRHVGHPPTRARGTIGGSLAHADPAAELPSVMVALDATLVAHGPDGERRIPAGLFFRGAYETALRHAELLVAIELRVRAGGAAFTELAPRPGEFAILSAVALVERAPDGTCTSAALVLGGGSDRPMRCPQAEAALQGNSLEPATIAYAVAALPLDAITMHSPMAPLSYRRRVAPVLMRRALEAAIAA